MPDSCAATMDTLARVDATLGDMGAALSIIMLVQAVLCLSIILHQITTIFWRI